MRCSKFYSYRLQAYKLNGVKVVLCFVQMMHCTASSVDMIVEYNPEIGYDHLISHLS